MEEDSVKQPQQAAPKRRAKRIVLGVILGMVCLVVLLPLSLYLPFVQDFVCRQVLSALNSPESEYEYRVGSIRIGFPLRLKVRDVDMLRREDGRTFLHVGLLETGLDDVPVNQPYFVLNRVHVQDVQLGMDSLTTSFGLNGSLQGLDAERLSYDPAGNQVRLHSAQLDQPVLQICMGPSEPDSIDEPSSAWYVHVDRLGLTQGQLTYISSEVSLADAYAQANGSTRYQDSSEEKHPYFDYNALRLTGINLMADSVHYDPQLIQGRILELAARDERSQLQVDQLHAAVTIEDLELISVRDLDLALAPSDYLRGDCELHLSLFDSIPSGYLQSHLQARIDSANLIRLAAPYLPALEQHWPNASTRLEVQGRLTPDSLALPHLTLDIPRHISAEIQGSGQQLMSHEQRRCAFAVHGDLPAADFLLSTFVDDATHRSYRLPDSLKVSAQFTQTAHRYAGRLDLQQSQQPVLTAEGNYDQQTEAYQLAARTQGLCVSNFMPGVIADRLTARLQADGRHFSFPGKYTRLQADVQVDTLLYACPDGRLDCLYALTAQASLLQGHYVADLVSHHPTLNIDTHLQGTFLPDSISAQGHLDVPQAYLAQLPYGLGTEGLGSLAFSSQLNAFYNGDDIAQVHLTLDSLTYNDEHTTQNFDDLTIHIESEPGILDAELMGGDASVVISSDCGLRDLPSVVDSLMAEVNRQRQALRFDFNAIQRRLPQMSVDCHMAQHNPFYQAFQYQTGYSFQSLDVQALNAYRLSLDGHLLQFAAPDGSLRFDTVAIDVRPEQEAYRYALHATHIDPRAKNTYDIHADGQLMPDSLTCGITYVNGNYLTLYDVMASLAIADDSLTLHLEKDPTIYEQPFTVNADNFISLMDYRDMDPQQGVNTRARVRLKGPHDLGVNLYSRKNPTAAGNQLLLTVRNLDLKYATSVMQWEGDAGGNYDMSASLDLFPDSLHARLRSGIRDFHLGDYRADTLSFEGISDMGQGLRDFSGKLAVDSIVKLNLEAHLADSIRVNGWIQELPLPLANAFLPNNMQLSGNTTGRLTVHGSDMEHASVDAYLALDDAELNYNDLDAQLRFCRDTIRLQRNRLLFDNYHIYAANGNPTTLNGLIDFRKAVDNPTINLLITGDNVCLIDNDRLRLPNQYITGRLPLSPDIRIRGTLSQLNVGGSLNILSGTRINYYMSDDPLQSSSRVDNLVEFVNFRQIDRLLAQNQNRPRAPMQAAAEEWLNIGLKIEVARDAKMTAHLAGIDDNRLDFVGGGSLNLQTDRQGDLLMTGTYDINSGKVNYKLPILPMVKTFAISNDSRVFWSGCDPTDPTIDIKATEEVKTTVNDASGSHLVKFLVTINIRGTLEALTMTFDCDAPEDGAISSDIASLTEDERSKTAMMLLITQTYVGPGATTSVGLGAANAALNSMLNREMESMLGNMKGLKGTDIDLGIDTYATESGSVRSSYSVKVSQRLFNDRFRATIGGQINHGGDIGQSQGAKLGDMSLEWLIRKDGTHYLKLFRRTNYESVLEGELIETGVSYIQERTGYRFRSLFLPTSKKRQRQLERLIKEMKEKESNTQIAE